MTNDSDAAPAPGKKPKSGWVNVLVDYGPILIFLIVYRYYKPEGEDMVREVMAVVTSTGAFVAAAIIALIVSKWRLGKISPMLGISTVLIVGFGGLTIFLADPIWIQLKPTAIYLFFGAALMIAWARGKALLQWALEAAFEGLSHEGWMKLSRNWGIFFFFLAALNEILRQVLSFGAWLDAKLIVFGGLSFLFTFSQIPMLLRHGLSVEGVKEEETNLPPN